MALPNNPQTRKEMYLSNMAGQGTALPSEPHTREEEYLDYIAKNGGGGGTGEGDMTKAVYDDDLAVASAGGIADYVAGAITGKVDKVQGKGLSTNDYDDSAKAIVDGVTTELGNKADKVSSATNGDLASLDSNGNLTDSGKKASDFYNSSETLETELDGQDKFPFYDFSASAKRQVTFGSIKAKLKEYFDLFYTNLVSSATNGNFAGLDANGNLTDSGKKASDFATASSVTAILDGTDIDSFGDVETALATKVDKVTGKGLSTNDYDNTAKAVVTTAQDNIIANTKLIKDTVGWSGKNIFDFEGWLKANSNPFTKNADGSYQFWTNNSIYDHAFVFSETDIDIILSSEISYPSSSPAVGVGFDLLNSNNEVVAALSANATARACKVRLNRQTAGNVIVKNPMIRLATCLDPTYEPYFGSTAFPRSEQAVLGAKNWFYSGKITDGQANITDTDNGKTIRIHNETAGSYKMGIFQMPVEKNTDYIFTTTVDWTSGVGNVGIASENAATDIKVYGQITSDKDVEVKFNSGNNSFIHVKLLCTWSDSVVGDVTYTNNMLRLATDPDDTYAPYAMTNRELTEIKTGTVSEYTNSYASFNTASAFLVSRAGVKQLYMFVTISTVAPNDDWIQIATLSETPTKTFTGINVPWDSALGSARSFVYQIDTSGKVYIRAKAAISSIISETFI